MRAHQLIHPWQLATTWTGAHRRADAVVTVDTGPAPDPEFITLDEVMLSTAAAVQPDARRRWNRPGLVAVVHMPTSHTLPDNRSHYYPKRCAYLETSSMSRLMDHL
jgi:hypothetical protein